MIDRIALTAYYFTLGAALGVALSLLSGCGEPTASLRKGASAQSEYAITLVARISSEQVPTNAAYTLSKATQVEIPDQLVGLSGLNEPSRAVLFFAGMGCAYHRDANNPFYVFLPGQCGAYTAGDVINLAAGDAITLSLPSGYTTQDASVQADLVLR